MTDQTFNHTTVPPVANTDVTSGLATLAIEPIAFLSLCLPPELRNQMYE
jgi:hypothetical protein